MNDYEREGEVRASLPKTVVGVSITGRGESQGVVREQGVPDTLRTPAIPRQSEPLGCWRTDDHGPHGVCRGYSLASTTRAA